MNLFLLMSSRLTTLHVISKLLIVYFSQVVDILLINKKKKLANYWFPEIDLVGELYLKVY